MKILERLQIVFMFLLSFLLVGGATLFTADVGWELLKDSYFYINQLITDTAIICVTFGSVYLYLDWFKENNEEYLNCINYIEEFSSGEKNIPSILLKFLTGFNRKRKISQYKYIIGRKISKLDYIVFNFIFFKVKKVRYSEEEMHIWNKGTEEEKAKSKYCRKRKMYEEQLDDSLIENIIDTTPVKYDRVTIGTLLSEYYTDDEDAGPNEFVEKHENAQIVKYRVPKLMFSFGFTLILSSIIFDKLIFNSAGLMALAIKCFTLLFNMWSSTLYAKKHANKITLHDARFRKGILMEYDKWLVQESEKIIEEEKLKQQELDKAKEQEMLQLQNLDIKELQNFIQSKEVKVNE